MSVTLISGVVLLLAVTCSSAPAGHDFDPNKYPVCGEKYQSPVDIEVRSTVFAAKYAGLKFLGYSSTPTFELINNGHTVKCSLKSHIKSIGISGSSLPNNYYLQQLHFHWGITNSVGSEHTVNGHAYPMEMHLVHYNGKYNSVGAAANKTDGLAVLGVFIEIGNEENAAFKKLIDHFGQIKHGGDKVIITDTFPVESLLSSNKADYYRYAGSLTTPPCYQTVTWTVFKEPITISASQIGEFRKLAETEEHMKNNFRPTKPLNGRTVYRSFQSESADDTSDTSDTCDTSDTSDTSDASAEFAQGVITKLKLRAG